MPELVVRFLLSLPAPTELLRRFLSADTVSQVWRLLWGLAILAAGGLTWLVLFRVSFAAFNPGRAVGRVLFVLALVLAAGAAIATGYLLARPLLGRVD